MSIYKHINRLNNNKWFYTTFLLLYINVNYSQDSIYKEFFFNSGEISSKGYLINNLPANFTPPPVKEKVKNPQLDILDIIEEEVDTNEVVAAPQKRI